MSSLKLHIGLEPVQNQMGGPRAREAFLKLGAVESSNAAKAEHLSALVIAPRLQDPIDSK